MKNITCKNLIFIIVLIFALRCDIIFASNILYPYPVSGPDINKPLAPEKFDDSQIYYPSKDKARVDIGVYNSIDQIGTLSEISKEVGTGLIYTVVPHYRSITTITGDYEWVEDILHPGKIRLFIKRSYDNDFDTYSRRGFYKINNDIYCFDINGDLITGLGKDEYSIIYDFGTDGKLINIFQG